MTTRWMAGVARRLAPPAAGSDSDLLARFVDARDPGAFAAIVARHGAAVYGVCRARLGHSADADDAFQVVFYVLARDARRIRDRESVAGWLMRVAHLTALKVRRHHARHPAGELPADVATTHPDGAAAAEERAIVAEELAALPDKFRSVLVLCAVEGRSNTEAAEALGCPRGTVDSRLAAAKAKLRQRLLRRGVGLAAVAGFEAALPRLGADAGGWPALADSSWLTAIQYGTGASHPTTLTLLADGVTTTMTTTTKLVATALLASGLLTTAGFGLTQIPGDGPPAASKADKAAKADAAKADAPKSPDAPKPPDARKPPELAEAFNTEQSVRISLARRSKRRLPDDQVFRSAINQLMQEMDVHIRFDLAAYKRLGGTSNTDGGDIDSYSADTISKFYETKLVTDDTTGLPLADILTNLCAQLPGRHAYRIRNGQILIGPAFLPTSLPDRVASIDDLGLNPLVNRNRVLEQVMGEPVSVSLDDVPLKDAIKELRRLTGANIVVNFSADLPRDQKMLVTATFDDVRLYTAIEILGDMAGLKPVFLNNVYYLTSPENAERLQKKVNEELFGREQKPLAVPAGYVTDGINMYRNPGNLKPVDNGSGIITGVEPAPVPVPAVKK